ncbi:hypothetical protein [Thalassotalea sp. PLHSN55]|uniref:hypothetical protein n=1 Tax=Thalassotalea sp. PLHSN55 TaxID=3435888 RepID=UPI003F86D87C
MNNVTTQTDLSTTNNDHIETTNEQQNSSSANLACGYELNDDTSTCFVLGYN